MGNIMKVPFFLFNLNFLDINHQNVLRLDNLRVRLAFHRMFFEELHDALLIRRRGGQAFHHDGKVIGGRGASIDLVVRENLAAFVRLFVDQ